MYNHLDLALVRNKRREDVAELKRTLGLRDTIALSLGGIIGAGIFVVIGVAAQAAGPSFIISIIIAGIIAALTGISVSYLVKEFPKEGASMNTEAKHSRHLWASSQDGCGV